ncbi:MAG: non-homologous end joining protein Ku [Tumebacillaceae bacterium]
MHTMWKGSISFGLVNIPVKMFAATEDKDIRFKYLHGECKTPVKNIRTCPTCDRQIEWSEVVKGYEYQPGQYVLMDDEEFEKIAPQRSKTIDILHFVDLKEIDPIYFNKSYYLSPEETGSKAYALLRKAMRDTGRIAVAKMILRSSQSLAVVRTYGDVLVMESIYYPDEVRGVSQLPAIPGDIAVDENELRVATQLIDSLAVPFDPEQYHDEYRTALQEAIERKIEGQEITTAAEPKSDQIHDLMAQLQASLNVTRREPAERPLAVGADTGAGTDQLMGVTAGEDAGEAKPKRRRRKSAE